MMKQMLSMLLVLLMLAALAGCGGETAAPQESLPPETAAPTEVPVLTVTTVDELLAALEPQAQIRLGEGTFRLQEASDYGWDTDSPYYSWVEV